MRRGIRLSLVLLALLGASVPGHRALGQSAPPPLPKESQILTGFDAFVALIGNTIVSAMPGKRETVFLFNKDGTVKFEQDGKVESGTWTFDGKLLCTIEGDGHKDCVVVQIRGDDVHITSVERPTTLIFKLLPGNPRSL